MSTFDGIVKEFPTIRVDYFRHHPDQAPPAALFLSHVHSDHLLGLESVKMPFVYCSVATKEMLLKMEKYPHRINFAKGILERRRQTYRHLKGLLRAIPMQTPTEIELGPKSKIRVTLFDANHCPGAVMFLIEGDDKAIVYTGDVRAEPWWVHSIVQNPILLPYTCGLKTLDCIYLDTTFATHDDAYKDFPTKAEGLAELIKQVARYPSDTQFYFRSWTLGYENVWIVLSDLLKSSVHVDEYQLRLLGFGEPHGREGFLEGRALTGFTLGNSWHWGCLTRKNDPTVRLHSCEPGMACHARLQRQKKVVWISPIISRSRDGTEIRELGAGGGWGDLYPSSGFTFDNFETLEFLGKVCAEIANDEARTEIIQKKIADCQLTRGHTFSLEGLENLVLSDSDEGVTFERFREALKTAFTTLHPEPQSVMPQVIHFPYSRHSSYNELYHLVSKFHPKDICPCTVDRESWTENMSMEALFGDLCVEKFFVYDKTIRSQVELSRVLPVKNGNSKRKRDRDDSQETASQQSLDEEEGRGQANKGNVAITDKPDPQQTKKASSSTEREGNAVIVIDDDSDDYSLADDHADNQADLANPSKPPLTEASESLGGAEDVRRVARMEAFAAAKRCLDNNDSNEWNWYPLRSIGRKGHDQEEDEL